MRAFIKKIMMIGLSLLSLCTMPVYAADEKPVLKLEDAVQAGFVYSNQISLNSEELDVIKDRLKAYEDKSYTAYQTVYLQKAKNERQKEFLQDQIRYEITNRYYTILLLQKEITYLDHKIMIMTRELEQMKVKKEIGLLDHLSYDNMATTLQDIKNTKQSKIEALNNDISYFKLITGKDVTKYALDEELKYETFRIPGAIENYMDTTIEEYLKGDEDLARFAKDNILTDAGPVVYYTDYLDKNYNADKALANLEDVKKQMKDALKNSYASLIYVEEQIGNLQTKYDLTKEQINVAKVQKDLELITQLSYEKQALNLEETELNLEKLKVQYQLLKQVIQKPWSMVSSK